MKIKFSAAAVRNIAETGCEPAQDVKAIRSGAHTRESLLAHCLDGAEEDRAEGCASTWARSAIAAREEGGEVVDVMHYSVPGLVPHRARTSELADARRLAAEVVASTGYLAVILVHFAVDGREVIELLEIVQP